MQRTISFKPLAVALIASFAGPAQVSAQVSTTRGFNLGFHLNGSTLTVDSSDPSGGGGAGLRIAYGINRIVTLYFQGDGAQVDVQNAESLRGTWTVGHADLGVRFHFANSLRRWVPYLEAALGTRAMSVTDAVVEGQGVTGDVTFSGADLSLGGGFMVYVARTVALDVEVAFTGGEFTQIKTGLVTEGGLNIDAQSSRFNVGVAWWP